MAELYYPEGFFETTLSADLTTSATTISLTAVPARVTSGYMVIEPSSSTKREVIHFTSVGASSVTAADDTTDSGDATGRGCLGSITVGANTTHDQGSTVIISATEQYWKRLYDTANNYLYSSLYRQALINGNFDVVQRATTFAAGANNDDVYTLDHWNLISDGNDVFDVSQVAVTDLPGSNYAIKLDVETAKRGGIVQFLEAKDAQKFKGKTVSISFKVKSANISALRATVLSWGSTADSITSDVVGTWAATPTWATNWADNATPADLTVTSSWTTVKVEGIAIDESTVNNLALVIWTPNEETIGDIVYISQAGLNEGDVALPFMPKSYEEERRACQRYCVLLTNNDQPTSAVAFGVAASTTIALVTLSLPVEMRTTPAITATAGDWQLSDTANSPVDLSAISLQTNAIGRFTPQIRCTVAAGLTANRPYYLVADGNADRLLILSAEL